MCWMLYLASDRPLPLAPFDRDTPGFRFEPVKEHLFPALSSYLSLRCVAYAGSHQGCGCGFMSVDYELSSDNESFHEEMSLRRRDVEQLAAYLRAARRRGQLMKWYLCWEGEGGTVRSAEGGYGRRSSSPTSFPWSWGRSGT